MKVELGWGGIRSLGIYRSNAAALRGTGRTVNQPSRNVIAVIRLLCMYLERSAHIPVEFAVKREKRETEKEGGGVKEKQTEREMGDTQGEGEINTIESCDVTRRLLLLFWHGGAASR